MKVKITIKLIRISKKQKKIEEKFFNQLIQYYQESYLKRFQMGKQYFLQHYFLIFITNLPQKKPSKNSKIKLKISLNPHKDTIKWSYCNQGNEISQYKVLKVEIKHQRNYDI